MFTELLFITLVCFLSGYQYSAFMITNDGAINLPGWSDHGIQVEEEHSTLLHLGFGRSTKHGGRRVWRFLHRQRLKGTHCTAKLCCPSRTFCCQDKIHCCSVFKKRTRALHIYC
nr:uncharacterized protein LOC112211429 [Halyomorpha halys]